MDLMKSVYLKRLIRVVGGALIVAAVFYLLIPPQPGMPHALRDTYKDKPLDVLCVGSSHMMNGLNPIQMFNEKGYAAYDFANISQAPWQSYFYIKEACKVKDPRLIIVDVYTMGTRQDVKNKYKDYQTVTNLSGFPLSFNKISAAFASKAESRMDILLRFPYLEIYRPFSGLTREKFTGGKDLSFGYRVFTGVEPYYDAVDVRDVTDSVPIHEKNEKYLRLIIEYCRENDIDLLLVNTPWCCVTPEAQRYFNYIGEVAAEYGVPFLNGCNYFEEMGYDCMTDTCGDNGHLNHAGVTKFTTFVDEYLAEHYDLPDRRDDPFYTELFEQADRWLEEALILSTE